jgi:signal transduction histidine kinase
LAAQTVHRQLTVSGLELPAVETALKALDRQSSQLGRLVERLLDKVRLQHGQLEIDLEEEDIETVLRDLVDRMRATTENHEIVFSSSGPAIAKIDPLRFDQIFTNLLDNAIKFSPDRIGPIEVTLESQNGQALVTVQDQGLGVPPDRRGQLFERFYQAHGDEHRSGMGLGLWISREIIERHGGSINAEFPVSGGTRMIVSLPLANAGAV